MAQKNSSLNPQSPVTDLPGISTTRGEAFVRLGIETLSDLCSHYPRAYENRGHIKTVSETTHGEMVSLVLTVGTQPKVATIRRGMVLLQFAAFDQSGSCKITYFNQSYLKSTFQVGTSYRFYGKAERASGRLQLSSPRFEPLPLGDPGDGSTLPPLTPIYKLSEGLTQKLMAASVARALPIVYPKDQPLPDPIPEEIRVSLGLCSRRFAIEAIHAPKDESSLDAARKRLIFEELFLFSLGLRLRRGVRSQKAGPKMKAPDMTPFLQLQPYTLTGAQTRAVDDFVRDMTAGGPPMNRLLSGDVGSGKTVCAAAAIYVALANGYQAALMAPTEILARQHYGDLAPMLASLGYGCRLLVGSTPQREKTEIKAALADGTLPFVVGTHALIEDSVVFARCGLVVTDEQHRFGVGQRAALANKAASLHTLIMSATPIPRTLALMLFGDLDMSVLDELPPGRQRISTFAVDESYRDRLNGFIRKQVEEGHSVYIVCPAVDETEEVEEEDPSQILPDTGRPTMKAAVAYARHLSEEVFPDLPVGFLHGKMKPAEKDRVMARFVSGELRILVSTTVIEVGVNVPSATLMVVEDAEHFGLSQLHQLRGRVGRGRDKSWCILVSDAEGENAKSRLAIMCKTNNGYEIAQRDLEIRGPGDFFASADPGDIRQSGGLRFVMASFCDDVAMVEEAFASAARVTEGDPTLAKPENAPLREAVQAQFGKIVL